MNGEWDGFCITGPVIEEQDYQDYMELLEENLTIFLSALDQFIESASMWFC